MLIPTLEWFPKAHWLRDYPQSRFGGRSLDSGAVLRLGSLTCDRKNELSNDEILLLMLWSTVDGDLSGLVTKEFTFGSVGESQFINLKLQLDRLASGDVLTMFVYEMDTPPLDPHDPVGAVSFFPNETYSVFAGDFRKPGAPIVNPLTVGRQLEVQLDAGRNGSYRMALAVERE